MSATPARIGFIQSQFRRVIAETTSAKTRHGEAARETDDPVETFFDNTADAQVIANARQSLLSPERRRFQVQAVGADVGVGVTYAEGICPLATYTDAERDVSGMTAIVADITIDFARQTSTFSIWG